MRVNPYAEVQRIFVSKKQLHVEVRARLKPSSTSITSYRANTSKISKIKFGKPAVGVFNSISPAGQTFECGTETSSGKDVSGMVTAKDVLVDEHSLLRGLRGK